MNKPSSHIVRNSFDFEVIVTLKNGRTFKFDRTAMSFAQVSVIANHTRAEAEERSGSEACDVSVLFNVGELPALKKAISKSVIAKTF